MPSIKSVIAFSAALHGPKSHKHLSLEALPAFDVDIDPFLLLLLLRPLRFHLCSRRRWPPLLLLPPPLALLHLPPLQQEKSKAALDRKRGLVAQDD